jgi:hypothetical protein
MKRTWIEKLFSKPARPATRRFRPRVDALESRETPASFYVIAPSAAVIGDPVTFNAGRPDAVNGTLGTEIFESLDEAVAAANAFPGTDDIFLAHTGADFLYIDSPADTPLSITESVNITGSQASASVLTTSNSQSDAVLLVTGAGVNVNLTNLSFYGGAAQFDGGGLVTGGGGQTGTAIRYTAGTTGTIDQTVWQGIFADNFLGVAIEATGTNTAVTVQNTQFSVIGRVGVFANSNASLSLFSSVYTGKGSVFALDYFAQVSSGATAVISGNFASGNQGVAGGSSGAVLVSQAGGASASADIFGNTFGGNINGIIVGDNALDTSTVTASYNNIFGNLNGISTQRDPAAADIDATNVFWDDANGPFNAANNPTGGGNDVADDVLFAPARTTQVPVFAAANLPAYLAAVFPQSVTVAAITNGAENPLVDGVLRFTRTGDPALPLTVNYTVGGTATAGADYATLAGTVVIPAGQLTADVPVDVTDDALVEAVETVVVTITASADYTVPAPGTATLTITSDDVLPAVSVAVLLDADEPAFNGLIQFTRTGDPALPLTVNFTIGGTATAGADYTPLTGSVVIPAGQLTVDVPLSVIDDAAVEVDETVVITITASADYTVTPPGTATLTITSDDPQPVVTISREFGAGADKGGGSATLYNPDGTVRFTVQPFGANFTGGVRVAAADFNGDGIADLVVGTGTGIATQVKVLNGVGGGELFAVNPFEAAFTGGVFVAAGDINGDGKAELVISPDEGGGPRVQIYNGAGFAKLADFFGIDDPAFRGGARPAVGDIDGDGKADLVVAAGFGGGPRVSVYSGASIGGTPVKLFGDFFTFEQGLRNGTFVAVGDINGDGKGDLISGGGPGGGPRVISLSGVDLLAGKGDQSARAINFFAGDVNARGGIRVTAKDLNGDANADLVVGDGTDAGSRVTGYLGNAFNGGGATPILNLTAFAGFNGGVFVG